jgi:hypothetical protein
VMEPQVAAKLGAEPGGGVGGEART